MNGRCGREDCYVQNLINQKIKGQPWPWTKLRAESSDYNIARAAFRQEQRPTKADISAEKQRRIDEVRRRFEELGETPQQIAEAMGHHGVAVYADLKAAGCDLSALEIEKNTARDVLFAKIKKLIDEGKSYVEIAEQTNLSPAMIGYHCRRNLGIRDGRSRAAATRQRIRTMKEKA